VFAAWQTWAQLLPATGKPWSAKHLNAQMQKKGFKISKSSTMQWQDIALRYDESDFVDEQGRPVTRDLPRPELGRRSGAEWACAASSRTHHLWGRR
jgi:putative DNA primase/helicase